MSGRGKKIRDERIKGETIREERHNKRKNGSKNHIQEKSWLHLPRVDLITTIFLPRLPTLSLQQQFQPSLTKP